ncbi:MAG: GPR endopeptidase, partial [Bacillota bacterium]|nr:GPR endopeptidase [Bacillota bacterium]
MLNLNFFSKLNINIDLAAEAHALLRGEKNREISGVSEKVKNLDNLKITEISILNEVGAKAMGRPQGTY